jgi:hypothetical protein
MKSRVCGANALPRIEGAEEPNGSCEGEAASSHVLVIAIVGEVEHVAF